MTQAQIESIARNAGGEISVFLGAGASAAAGLPTMVSFLDKAYGEGFVKKLDLGQPYYINSNNVSQVSTNKTAMALRLFQAAGLGSGKPPIDLEEIFDFIHKSGVMNASKETIKALLWTFKICQEGHSWDFAQSRKSYVDYSAALDGWLQDFQQTVTDLRRKMYESFLIDSTQNDILSRAESCYRSILKLFPDRHATVFTTNYDTIFEALNNTEQLGRTLIDGFGKQRPPHYDAENFLASHDNSIFYFKLHGSVTWHHNPNGKIRDFFPSVPKNVVLLEPVISKTPDKAPFTHLYSIFEQVLKSNTICVCIGFSFRDDSVRNIMLKRLESSKPFTLIIVAPEDEKHPQLNQHLQLLSKSPRVHWLKDYWGEAKTDISVLEKVCDVSELSDEYKSALRKELMKDLVIIPKSK